MSTNGVVTAASNAIKQAIAERKKSLQLRYTVSRDAWTVSGYARTWGCASEVKHERNGMVVGTVDLRKWHAETQSYEVGGEKA